MKSVLCWPSTFGYRVYIPLEYSCYASDTPLEKSDFPFSRSYKWQLASWLEVWFCTHFPFFLLVLLSCLNMWRPWAYSPRLCEITCPPALLCLDETVSGTHPDLWLLQSFGSLFIEMSVLCEEEFDKDIQNVSAHCPLICLY